MLHSIHDLKKVFACVSIFLALQMAAVRSFGQASPITPTTTTSITGFNVNILESMTGWAGTTTNTGITSWHLQGSGSSYDYRGTAQASGTSGGFYGSSNISFLGSGNASNGNATLRLQNTTGSTITAFRVVYTGKLWKSGTASPAVSVSWSTNSSNSIPSAGALTNSLASLGFSDATTNITTGVQLAQSVSSVSITNNNYVFLRWIHPGGSSADNLGWDEVYFVPQPITQASAINFSSVSATGMTVNWTNGNGRRRAVFMKSGSGTITNPSDGTSYTASTTFAGGTQLGTSGYYCIYDGTGTSVAVTGLSASTTYYVQVFEYNSDATPTAITITYLTSAVSANQVTNSLCTTPTAFGLTGGGSYCPGGSGVAIGVANSQTGVNYQLYRGTSAVGSAVAGTGSALPLGTFAATGTYTVRATTSVGSCTNGMTGSVAVSQYVVPTIYAVTGGGSYCTGGSGVSIGLAGSQTGVNYQLYSGSTPVGSSVAGTGSSIGLGTYATAATYTVLATDGTTGCTSNMSSSAVVSIDPLPAPSISGSTSIPSGGSAVLTFSGEPGDVVYYWNGTSTVFTTVGSDGTSTVTVTPTGTTTYSITTATSAAGCIQSISGETATVTVSSLPTAGISGATDICIGQSTNIVFSGTAGATVYYNSGAGPLSVTLSGTSGIGSFSVAVTPTVTTTYTLDSIVSAGYHGSLSGSAMVSVNPLPTTYPVTGTGSYCSGGAGLSVGLSNSENNVDYQLYNGATPVGSAISGTGAAISFGSLTTAATYTVFATNTLTGCTNAMSGNAIISINPLPTVFTVTGGGSYCSGGAGVAIGLNNSESGVNYQLYNGASTVGSPVAGTGAAISFGNQTLAVTYTVAATNATTGCSANMSSSATVTITPPTNAGTITGPSTISLGLTGTLSNAVSGGVWSSSNTAVATIGTSTGIASGLSLGTTTISYTVTGTCGTSYATRVLTVTALTPSSISANAWSGMTASSASGASTFATLPASTTPGSSVINISQWNRGSGLGVGSATGTYSSNNFTSTSLASAQSGNTFLTFTVTNDATTEVKLTQFFLSTQVSSSGPTNIQLLYKIGSGTEQNFAASQATATTGSASSNTFTGTACIPPGSTATFKLYGWGGASAGTFRVNNTTSITATYITGVSSISVATSSGNSPVCAGTALNLTGGSGVNGAPAYTYSWAGPSFSSSSQNPSISSATTANAGTYTLTVTDQMGCSASNTTAVTVNTVAATAGSLAVCVGNTTSLSNATSGGTWSSGNGSVASVGTSGVVTGVAGGTARISYQAPSGCYATAIVTVNTFPVVVATAVLPEICAGSGTNISATGATTYSWSPATGLSATTGATIAANPTVTTTYTITGTTLGCSTTDTATVTVNPLPAIAPITGAADLCVTSTITLADATVDGIWSSSTNVTINPGGVVTGVTTGLATVTYTVTNSSGCTGFVTTNFAVNALPIIASITGPDNVCVGSVITLSNATTGGTWSSSSSDATVSGGVVTGVTAGSSTITYTVTNGSGCTDFVTTNITINALPTIASITGSDNVCASSVITLSNATTGGTWSSSSSDATVSGGVVTGVTAGSSTITYTVTNGFGCTDFVTTNVTVNALPSIASITGPDNVCAGSVITLSNTTTGGTWSSSSSDATVSGGIVTGVTAGSSIITYTVTNGSGCTDFVTINITVNALPTIASITGADNVCASSVITLSNATTGGTWSSSSSDATVSGGIVTGVTAGSATISYTVTNGSGCTDFVTTNITVNALPSIASITGPDNVCAGSVITLSNTTTGGTWSSSSSDATVSGGIVTGVTAGSATITYTATNGSGCTDFVTTNITINALPTIASITGSDNVCVGSVITLSDATTGGVWSSSSSDATVSGGVVTGVTAGSSTITYTVTNGFGCTDFVTTNVTVNALPTIASITGSGNVCAGSVITLSNATTGGIWSSSSSDATVSGGIVTGVTAGSSTITYTVTNGSGCTDFVTTNITVNALPTIASITGADNVCVGSSITLSNATTGGTWSSSSSDATVSGGVVTGVTAGSSTITYTVTNGFGCTDFVTTNVTVNALPSIASIAGTDNVCVGSVITLSNATTGGTWSSSSSDATVSGGVVTGITAGSSTITYTVTNGSGCTDFVATNITVNALPTIASIAGADNVCVGSVITLSDATTGGTWSSSSSEATVSGGTVTGVTAGSATITYTVTNGSGCTDFITTNITVNALPIIASITGADNVCAGSVITLSNATTGGTWSSSSSNTTVSGGIVAGVTAGSSTITYTITNGSGCTDFVVTNITVNALPTIASITGADNVCVGSSITLSNTTTGGTWSNSSSDATVSGGIVTGVTAGSSIITYTVTNGSGCTDFVTTNITVNALPTIASIAGSDNVCVGASITLSDATTGGTWSSSPDATVSGGVVTGVTAGSAIITYSVTSGAGCTNFVTTNITVNALPTVASITGADNVCVGSAITLSDATSGGTWSSSNPEVIAVDSTGTVTGVTVGSALIYYVVHTICGSAEASKPIVVNPITTVSPISGSSNVCVGSSISLTDVTSGGYWVGGAPSASVSASGVVTGSVAGTAVISYIVESTCIGMATKIVTINPLPGAGTITGSSLVLPGSSLTLGNAVAGGTWNASNGNATVSSTGVVTGVTLGSVTISYSVTNSCGTAVATKNIVVSNLLPIEGTFTVCAGSTTSLSEGIVGGTWVSSNTAKATVLASGVVTGVSAGTAAISYVASGSAISVVVTVNASPAAIGGTAKVCPGTTATLTDATAGGVWSSGDPGIAAVNAAGVLTGVVAGTADIIYTLTNGCSKSVLATINPNPANIAGSGSVCVAATISMSSATPGLTWGSSDLSKATVNSVTGVVTGVATGTSKITYRNATTGCLTTTVVAVSTTPASIAGILGICPGSATTLSNTIVGGTWNSSDPAIATVNAASGVVTGVVAGTTTIVYTVAGGCSKSSVVTVNATPIVNGALEVCVGKVTGLSITSPASSWSSSNTAIATVSSGAVTGVAMGTADITVTATTGCKTIVSVLVNGLPPAISGTLATCVGSSTTLSNAMPGGTWSSNAPGFASISGGGEVTGVVASNVIITYTSAGGCVRTGVVTVNAAPVIMGTASMCVGTSATLVIAGGGSGTWSSGAVSQAIVGSTGIVTGVSAGSAPISFTSAIGCVQTAVAIVNVTPDVISGPSTVCAGSAITLSNSLAGGIWSSSSNASVGTAGNVTGIIAGPAAISYTIGSCRATRIVTVLAVPGTIGGTATVCQGATTSLTNTWAGTWSSLHPAITSISASGVVTGVTAGNGTIVFTHTNGCQLSRVITVNVCSSRQATTGIGTTELNTQVSMFPNPTNGMVTIQAPTVGTLSVLAVDGKEVVTYHIAEGSTNIVLPADLAAGVYMCRFIGNEGSSAMVRLIYQP